VRRRGALWKRYALLVKLEDIPPPTQVRSAPIERNEPTKDWRPALRSGLLPSSLVDFYNDTGYLSASRLAGFDTESKRVLTVYINRLFGSLKECVVEAHEQALEHKAFLRETYDPTKGSRDEQAEELARRKARAAFRLFLIDIFGAFDAVAELIAVFLPGELERLTLGRGMFTQHVYEWAARPLSAPGIIISPARPFVERLHAYIRAEVVDDAVGAPWFSLLRAYRNKVTHLGHQTWQEYGLQAADGNIYYFLPRAWPSIPERDIQIGPSDRPPTKTLMEHMADMLVHVDVPIFVDETYSRVVKFVDGCVRILYDTHRALGVRQIEELARHLAEREIAKFTTFEPAG
jgi:hypothetical protein